MLRGSQAHLFQWNVISTVWGCFSAAGPGSLVKVEEKLYRVVAHKELLPRTQELRLGQKITLKQDIDPEHASQDNTGAA